MMMKSCMLCVVTAVLVLVTPAVLAKPGGFYHTSFLSTGGSNSTGAAESQVTDADGTTKGECIFFDSEGRSTKIKYRETPDGEVTAEADQAHVTDAKAELKKCKEAVANINEEVQKDLKEHQKFFENQQANFQKQQEEFRRQQEEFQNQMMAFQTQLQNEQRTLQESLKRQQQQFYQRQEQLYQNFYKIPKFNFK